jgi:hypothetical protein
LAVRIPLGAVIVNAIVEAVHPQVRRALRFTLDHAPSLSRANSRVNKWRTRSTVHPLASWKMPTRDASTVLDDQYEPTALALLPAVIFSVAHLRLLWTPYR